MKIETIESATGKYYYIAESRQLHRDNGPAIEKPNGDLLWYQYGELHRDKGPAIELANGDKEWWKSGRRHREDGPAIEYADGAKEYYLDGYEVHEGVIYQEASEQIISNLESKSKEKEMKDGNRIYNINGKKYFQQFIEGKYILSPVKQA